MSQKYVPIKFKNNAKAFYFSTEIFDLKEGDKIVCESVRGIQIGEVAGDVKEVDPAKQTLDLKPVLRKATSDDLLIFEENEKRAIDALKFVNEQVSSFKLEMTPIQAEYTLDGSKLTITYLAEERVDFRELLKVLAGRFKVRIELRQIGSRDKAKMISGLGPCGLPLCCATFLNQMEGISIAKAKNQMLSLNIPKLSGQCGKLICCLAYEDDNYTELKKEFPRLGDKFKLNDIEYKITGYNVFSKMVKVESEQDIQNIPLEEVKKLLEKSHAKPQFFKR